MKHIFLLLCMVVPILSGCYYDNLEELTITPPVQTSGGGNPVNTCDTTNATLYADVAAIVSANCGVGNSCHGTNNTSGYDLTNYAGVKAIGQTGQFYGAITHNQAYIPMPQGGGSLGTCDIAKIKRWIANGYAQ